MLMEQISPQNLAKGEGGYKGGKEQQERGVQKN